MYIIYDTETTGLPKNWNAPITDSENWPRMVQIAWQVHDKSGKLVEVKNYIIKPEGYEIPYAVVKVHRITTERALEQGMDLQTVLQEFNKIASQCEYVIGHNISFDNSIVGAELYRKKMDNFLDHIPTIDTKDLGTDFCAIKNKNGRNKWPKLGELYEKLFDEPIIEAHNAAADVEATSRCFLEMLRREIIPAKKAGLTASLLKEFKASNPNTIKLIGLNIEPYNNNLEVEPSESTPLVEGAILEVNTEEAPSSSENEDKPQFTHLHLHTQYSILDGMTNIKKLVKKVKADGMTAVAITDHGNMYGAKEFHSVMTKAGIKPILGTEAYVAVNSHLGRGNENKKYYHLVLLAKNEVGYKNLIKLASIAFSDGYYYKPRIDIDLLRQYHEGIIASSACLAGEINRKLMNESVSSAEEALLKYVDIFGEDFYIELQRHQATDPKMNQDTYPDQVFVNKHLLELAEKHNVKYIATNDVHYLNEEDADAHDRLICLSTGKMVNDNLRMRYSGQEWLKTRDEMAMLFADLPKAISNTQEIVDKVENYELDKKPIMPDFALPKGFDNEDKYLRHISYEGAHMRWGEKLTDDVIERLDFELNTIQNMGFPGYFLIVWDFLKAARNMGVSVGPGRGSAAGSAVAYCLRITDIDPLKYNLLFERFLNPDRISMPDIDIDFDDAGREKVLQWVKEKYGAKRVAHLITFGTMAAKSSIKDVARVQDLPLSQSNALAKFVPDKPGTTLEKAFNQVPEFKDILDNGKQEERSVLQFAKKLEGSVRNTGTHACGIIISKDDLDKYVPITHVKDSSLDFATQYDGHYVEDIGLLKMDFLGLKTLTIIKDALANIKISKGIDVDIENVELEDKETYELYSRGETTGLFQFESDGMKKHLKNLKPTKFEDLIAMNALYRPGPMEYIDSFVARKHGREAIKYDLEGMDEYLAETYGITVYQEQVMLLSRKLANFTPGMSDSLRKAMGKKIISMMNELKVKFEEGCKANGHDDKMVQKVWKDWEKFASYAFNKSHATCYSFVSYQTAYLKTHHPAEFMASILSHELKDMTKLNLYLGECSQMGIKVLGPSINESYSNFTVNLKGEIRYGLAGIKGVGEAAVASLIAEREENGQFESVFDLVKRVNLRTVNKKAIEALAMAGSFDGLQNSHRAQFFYQYPEGDTFLERVIKHGNKVQAEEQTNQASLFGEMEEVMIKDPDFPECEPWGDLKRLKLEKELIGFYLSGHPLDNYKETINSFVKNNISQVLQLLDGKEKPNVSFAGIVSQSLEREAKNGNKYGLVTIEDENASIDIWLFKENYLKYRHFLLPDTFIYVKAGLKTSYRDKDKLELNLTGISLLENLMDDSTKEILLQVHLQDINDGLISDFKTFAKENPGNARLRFYFTYQKQHLEMLPKRIKVKPKAFIEFIKKYPSIQYKLK